MRKNQWESALVYVWRDAGFLTNMHWRLTPAIRCINCNVIYVSVDGDMRVEHECLVQPTTEKE